MTIGDAAAAIRRGELSPTDLVEMSLERLDATEPHLHAFVLMFADQARIDAERAEQELAAGRDRGPLHGIPFAVKDVFDVAGAPTRAGSTTTSELPATTDATVVGRLRDAGAVLIGKTNSHELALGVVTPPTANPWNPDFAPGGSSGGSAAAVAAGVLPLALGSDTGGSIRGPASACGAVGLKPTYGLVSNHGVTTNSWSLDTSGPITSTVTDAAMCLTAIAGYDVRDPRTSARRLPDYSSGLDASIRGVRVGVPRRQWIEVAIPPIAEAVLAAAEVIKGLGAQLIDIELPHEDLYLPALRAIQGPEISSYHARTLRECPERIGGDVRLELEAAALVPVVYNVRAHQARRLIVSSWQRMFAEVDVVLGPTYPCPPPRHADAPPEPADVAEAPVMNSFALCTAPANLVGAPAISVPCGLDTDGVPCGLQIVAPPFDDETALRVAYAYEASGAWLELTRSATETG